MQHRSWNVQSNNYRSGLPFLVMLPIMRQQTGPRACRQINFRQSRSVKRRCNILVGGYCCQCMSALPPKADIRCRDRHVRVVPKADILRCDIERRYSITSSARTSSESGIVRLSAFVVLRLAQRRKYGRRRVPRSAHDGPQWSVYYFSQALVD